MMQLWKKVVCNEDVMEDTRGNTVFHIRYSKDLIIPWKEKCIEINLTSALRIDIVLWWIVFVVWLTDEKGLVSFPARTIVRDLYHTKLLHTVSRIWTCAEPESKLSWLKLSSTDNHYTAVLYQHKKGIIPPELALQNRQEAYEIGKKRKRFLFKAFILSLLAAVNLSKRKWKIYQVEIQIWH